MPRRLLKRYLPDHNKVKNHKHLRCFGDLLHSPNIWHLNRHSVARALSIGLFVAFLPIPFQMVVAAALAIVFRANLPLAAILVWVTNPITIPPIFYFAYKVGAYLLGMPPVPFDIDLSISWIQQQLGLIWYPLLLGSLVCGISSAALAYIASHLFWRYRVMRNWGKRKSIKMKNYK